MQHYRCYCVYVWGTKSERVVDTLAWFPTWVKMHTMLSLNLALAAAQDLLTALLHPSPGSPLAPTTDSQTAALKQLVDIFQDCTQCSPLLLAEPSASTKEVLENGHEAVKPAGTVPRVNPSNNPPPTVPPGFTHLPSPRVPTTIPITMPASVPRKPVQHPAPMPATPTYENTAIGSTQCRCTCETNKPSTAVPHMPTVVPAPPIHVANSIHVHQALKQALPDPMTTPTVPLLDIERLCPWYYLSHYWPNPGILSSNPGSQCC
jgi:hypothetical protein